MSGSPGIEGHRGRQQSKRNKKVRDKLNRLLKPFPLQYVEHGLETEYLKWQVQKLSEALPIVIAPAVCAVLVLLFVELKMGSYQEDTEASHVSEITLMILVVVMVLLVVMLIYALFLRKIRAHFRIHDKVLTFLIFLVMAICCMADRYYCARLLGHEPFVILKSSGVGKTAYSDSGISLGIILCVMVPNLLLPIRGQIVMYLNMSGMVFYLWLVLGLGSSERPLLSVQMQLCSSPSLQSLALPSARLKLQRECDSQETLKTRRGTPKFPLALSEPRA